MRTTARAGWARRRQELPRPAAPPRGRRLRRADAVVLPVRRPTGAVPFAVQRARRRRRPVRRRDQRRRRAGRHRPDDRPSSPSTWRMPVRSVDVPSSLVTVGPGMRGPALEDALAPHGLASATCPELETRHLGGYAATRSAGQSSTGVGRFDDLVAGLTLATPSGVLESARRPRAAGPDPGSALGSEAPSGNHRAVPAGARTPSASAYEAGVPLVARAGRAAAAGPPRTAAQRRPPVRPGRDPCQPAHGRRRGARALRGTLKARRRGEQLHVRGRLGGVADAGPRAVAGGGLGAPGERCGAAGAAGSGSRGASISGSRAVPARSLCWTPGCWWETVETAATWAALPTRVRDLVRPALRESLARGDSAAPGDDARSRTATRPGPRSTSPCWPTATHALPLQQWLGREAGGHRRAPLGRQRHVDPPPRGGRRPRPRAGARGRPAGRRGAPRGQAAPGPHNSATPRLPRLNSHVADVADLWRLIFRLRDLKGHFPLNLLSEGWAEREHAVRVDGRPSTA